MTPEGLLALHPGMGDDLRAAEDWMGGPVLLSLASEPMEAWSAVADEMLAWQALPDPAVRRRKEGRPSEDRRRTARILRLLRKGEGGWPILVDARDGFLLEGRHRLAAMRSHGLPEVGVVRVLPCPRPRFSCAGCGREGEGAFVRSGLDGAWHGDVPSGWWSRAGGRRMAACSDACARRADGFPPLLD